VTACAVLFGAVVAIPLRAYPKGPPAGVTGGFGEETCAKCHKTYAVNAGREKTLGDLVVTGLPAQYQPGETYALKVEVTHERDGGVWGFQLAARTKGAGAQAGTLEPKDTGTQVVTDKGIQYIEHTAEGIFANVFEFSWTAPAGPVGDVAIDVAANAADGDASPVGDYIYSSRVIVPAVSH
jgi:hypothetical protein